VVAARRISLRQDGQERKTKQIVLTFDSTTLPDAVRAGYLHCRVRPYVPNPRRCFKCQRFGHGSHHCRGKATCAKCAKSDHPAESCTNDPHCVNCGDPHPAYSRSCRTWKEEKEVLSLKVKENLSYPEARRRFAFLRKGSYSQVVQRGPAPLMVAVATQTSFLDYGKKRQSPTPQLKIQLPGHVISAGRSTDPPSQSANPCAPTGQQSGSSQAVSQTQEGPVAAAAVPPPRSPSREKGRHSRAHSLERASSKERHSSRAAPAAPKGQERVDFGGASPSTSSAPLAGSGRGRRMAPRSSDLKKHAGKASPQETEAMDECEVSTPASDQDDMEWQTTKSKHKSKKTGGPTIVMLYILYCPSRQS
ncbi:hypothetical protein ISCGN_006343, partial [Ixodes scapularis]